MKSPSLILAASLVLGACTLGPDFQRPAIFGGTKWKESQVTSPACLPDTWWCLFGDRELTGLIQRALSANYDLSAASARVQTSRALIGVDRARWFPTLSLNGKGGIARASQDATASQLPPGITIDLESQRYRGTFDLSYDPDLWGRNKRLVQAATAQAEASEALLDAQRLGVATEVARQYFLLSGLDAQETVLLETIRTRQSTHEIQKSKADAGLIDGLSTSQARTELELARNDLAVVQRQRGSAEHALAVLCAKSPSEFSLPRRKPSAPLPTLHASPPAQVLARRPDVRAAEQVLRATTARIGVAEAAFYPSFTLGTGAGLEAADVKNFLDWENRVLSLGAGVAAPIIDGGANKANYQAALSRRDEALAAYRNSLLVALREVEDCLADLKGLARSRAALERALTSAKETLRLSQERYDKGLSSYLEVVEADRTVLRVQLVLAQTDAQQRITLAALAKALGGGWSGK